LNDPFEIPSLEEIKEMERQRSQAIESLQLSDSDSTVKCQRYGIPVPIVGKLSKPHNDRVAVLQRRIKWMENYRHGSGSAKNHEYDDVKALKQELAALLEEDAKADKAFVNRSSFIE
jgi:hypothetical protein